MERVGQQDRHAGRNGRALAQSGIAGRMRIRRYRDDDLGRVEALWRACNLVAPYNDPGADIAFCQSTGHGEVFVGEDKFGEVMATVMVGHDGHRGWVYYLAV